MIDENRIKNILLDIRKQCKKIFNCVCCPYQEICRPCMVYFWKDEEIENMAAGLYELLKEE